MEATPKTVPPAGGLAHAKAVAPAKIAPPAAVPAESSPSESSAPPVRRKNGWWQKWGGGSLTIAALIHAVLITLAVFWIFEIIKPVEKKVDFMPGGSGGAARGAEMKVQRKKQTQMTPVTNVKRVFAEGKLSNFAIPDQGEDFGQMSTLSSIAGGGMSGGIGGTGQGKGFGKGVGTGNGLGNGLAKGIKLFGMPMEARTIGVVLDVSRSMTPRLRKVVDEVNRVAPESPIVLHFGCGLQIYERKQYTGEILPVTTSHDGFKRFWLLRQGTNTRTVSDRDKESVNISGPIPGEEVFNAFAHRPKTYYHDNARVPFTKEVLLSSQLRNVEAIYWFADFKDLVEPSEAQAVLEELKRRHQKLYIQVAKTPKQQDTPYADMVRKMIAVPSGGTEVKPIDDF